jgi:hypothetical protein
MSLVYKLNVSDGFVIGFNIMIVLFLFLHADRLLNIFRCVSYWHIKQFAQRSTQRNHREYWFRYKPDNTLSVGAENTFHV